MSEKDTIASLEAAKVLAEQRAEKAEADLQELRSEFNTEKEKTARQLAELRAFTDGLHGKDGIKVAGNLIALDADVFAQAAAQQAAALNVSAVSVIRNGQYANGDFYTPQPIE